MYGGVGDKTGVEKKGLIPKLVMAFIKGSQRDMNAWIAAYGWSVEGTVADLEEGERAYPDSDYRRVVMSLKRTTIPTAAILIISLRVIWSQAVPFCEFL